MIVSRQLYFTINLEEILCFLQEKMPYLCGFWRFANAYFIYKGKENENVARKYKRLNYEDRKAIEAMCKQGKRAEEIAEAMDVHRATIYHELKRGGAENGNRKQYSADMAQKAI